MCARNACQPTETWTRNTSLTWKCSTLTISWSNLPPGSQDPIWLDWPWIIFPILDHLNQPHHHTTVSVSRDDHRWVGGGSPQRKDLEHFIPSPTPPPVICTPVSWKPIAFKEDEAMNMPAEGQTPSWTPNPPQDAGSMEPNPLMNTGAPEPKWIRRITYGEEGAELTAGLPEDFSGEGGDATRWILAMAAYFTISEATYAQYDNKTKMLVMLNKMSKGRGATFSEGWDYKIFDKSLPCEQKTFRRLSMDFHWAFILKDLQDWAWQELYSLSMDQFDGDFNEYTSTFWLAQAHSRINLDSILVDALQWGVSLQLATMITTATLPAGQEVTVWEWEQWLNKAGEFYRNMIQLRNLRKGDTYVTPEDPPQKWTPVWIRKVNPDADAMDVNQIKLLPHEKRRHMKEDRCFLCHKPGCWPYKHLTRLKEKTAVGKGLQTPTPQWTAPAICMTSTKSITILVGLYLTKNGKVLEMEALVDSGVTINCVDWHPVNRMKWPLKKLYRPMYTQNADGITNMGGQSNTRFPSNLGYKQ